MQLYLIRHTTPDIAVSRCYGQSDIGVATSFTTELNQILGQQAFPAFFDNIYSSPSQRCQRLAECLPGARRGTDARLLELCFGDWELQDWDQIDRAELDHWAGDVVLRCPPGGESLMDLYQRTEQFLATLDQHSNSNIAVVTHAGVIRCVWAYITQIPLQNVFRIRIDYGDVFVVTLAADRRLATIGKL
jgi:alpha-ribazole phosphatase